MMTISVFATKCPENYTSYAVNYNSGCFKVQTYDFHKLCCPNNGSSVFLNYNVAILSMMLMLMM